MATKKFSELTVLDTVNANLVLTVIPVYDTSSGTTRKVTLQQINDSIEANIPFAAAAFTQANIASNNATTADQKALAAGNYANSAFNRANNSLNVSVGGTITGDISITGNLSLTGCTATLSVSTLRTSDHVIDIGHGTTGAPSQNAGIRVLRGDESAVQIRWNESTDKWQYTNDGTSYNDISSVDSNKVDSAFNVANTSNVNSIIAGQYANAAFDAANTANTLAQAAFDTANNVSGNTGNVTFSNQVVQGTGDEYGGGGLYLAPGPDSTSNLQYLRVRGGDAPTHIHFDTGNNSYYDQYFGDDGKYVKLGADGVVSIGTNSNVWSFDANSSLIFPDNSIQNTAYTGLLKFSTVTTSTHTFNELTEDILFCDPNSAGSQISIYLPDSIANGKSFTVKNINAGGNVVYVQVQTGTTPLEIETGSVGTFNYANIANTGSSITWLFDGTTYRIINEVIR